LDRASVYETEGHRFESCQARSAAFLATPRIAHPEPIARLRPESAFRTPPSRSGRFREVVVSSWSHFGATNRVLAMADDAKAKVRRTVREAQAKFVREQDAAQQARRKAFAEAQKAGLSLRDIGDEVGLHRSRIAQIIAGK
jgi:hypothetical protein